MSSEKSPTRDRILNAAWRLLESGARAVRMSDIAKAAGISRQALYLHYPSRADLLVATVRHVDEVKKVDDRLVASRTAASGRERLDAFIAAWGSYIPEIHGVSIALRAMADSDEEAARAWEDRMQALRHGCAAAVRALAADGALSPDLAEDRATDLLWALLSVEAWERLVRGCGWSQESYVTQTQRLARRALVG